MFSPEPDKQSASTGISARGIVTGLVLVAIISFIVSYAELVTKHILVGSQQLPPAVVGIFLLLILVNRALRAMGNRFRLSSTDLVMVYCMMLVSALTSARGVVEKLLPVLVTPGYFANPSNRWEAIFWPHIRNWMVPFDPSGQLHQPSPTRFYEGLRAGETIPWNIWAVPLAAWGILCLLIVSAFLCLAVILRKQWVEHERLSFPLAQPPLEMIREEASGKLFRNRLLWVGFAIPVLVYGLNGLHNWYPNLPLISVRTDLNQYFTTPPWNTMGGIPLYLSFAAIGFCYLLPSEVLFSLWFFFILSRLQAVVAASFGMQLDAMPMYPCYLFVGYQVAGAYIALMAYLMYMARPHLKRVVADAFARQETSSADELISYRTAFWGLMTCFALTVVWCCLAGLSPMIAFLEMGVFIFIVAVVMARSTCEAGMFMTETSFRPVDLYKMFAPVHTMGAENMTVLALLDGAFMRDQRGLVLTGFMDGLKMTDGSGTKRRSFLPGFLMAIVLAIILAGGLQLWIAYTRGGLSLYEYAYQGNSLWAFWDYQQYVAGGVAHFDWRAPVFFAVGVLFTVFLSYMRARFYWWPFHPLGYAVCGSWSMIILWFSCFFVWIVKSLLLRYGGHRLYARARPLFIGMMFGEFAMAAAWTLISALTGAPTPEFPWP